MGYRSEDRVIIAYYSGPEADASYQVFNFKGLSPGSAARGARCAEYDRLIEALKGQGCDVHVWDIATWPKYKRAFMSGRLRRNTT